MLLASPWPRPSWSRRWAWPSWPCSWGPWYSTSRASKRSAWSWRRRGAVDTAVTHRCAEHRASHIVVRLTRVVVVVDAGAHPHWLGRSLVAVELRVVTEV